MTPAKLLEVAEDVQDYARKLGHDAALQEAAFRSVLNRAYYGAFLHAREYLRTRDGNPQLFTKAPKVHAAVIGVLEAKHASSAEQDAGEALSRMRDRRVKADYRLKFTKTVPPWSLEADDQVADAAEVFKLP